MHLIFQEDSDKDSPLHNAVHGDNVAIAQLLIEKGAKVDVKNENGDTPLQLALKDGHEKLFMLMLKHGGKEEKLSSFRFPEGFEFSIGLDPGVLEEYITHNCIKIDNKKNTMKLNFSAFQEEQEEVETDDEEDDNQPNSIEMSALQTDASQNNDLEGGTPKKLATKARECNEDFLHFLECS